MYKINILSSGKYHNVVPGVRYTFTKKSARALAKLLLSNNCEIEIFKFCHLTKGIYAWSDDHDLYGGLNADWDEWVKYYEEDEED